MLDVCYIVITNCSRSPPNIMSDSSSILLEALEAERKRNATLTSQLERVRHQSTMRSATRQSENESLSVSMNNLSIATLNIGECKPMDGEDEIDKRSFEAWRSLLEASMKLVGVTDEETKMSIFRIKAGPKLLEIFENTGSSSGFSGYEITPYTDAMRRLMDHFGSRDYTLLQRQKLRSLTQGVGETDLKYVKRVINIAKLCDYDGTQLLDNIADVIQSHALNLRIREIGRKCLRKGGSISTLLEKVRAVEIGQLNEEIFAKSHAPPQVAIVTSRHSAETGRQYFTDTRPEYDRHFQPARTVGNQQRFSNPQMRTNRGAYRRESSMGPNARSCWRCMSKFHPASNCPSMDKVCRNCLQKGHLARTCNLLREPQKRKVPTDNGSKLDEPVSKKIAILSKEDSTEDQNVSF